MDLDNIIRMRKAFKIPESDQQVATASKAWWWQIAKAAEEIEKPAEATEEAEERGFALPWRFDIGPVGADALVALRVTLERPFASIFEELRRGR